MNIDFKRVILFCALFIGAISVLAQARSVDDLAAAIDTLVASSLEESGTPGISIAVIDDGEVVWSNGYGLADTETGEAVTADTPFAAWSISKILTATVALQLVEADAFDLDAPVLDRVEGFELPLTRHNLDLVTPRRILSHTAGFGIGGYPAFPVDVPIPTLIALLSGEGSDRLTLMMPPGVRFMYSGGGYGVLQLALEAIAGVPYAEQMQTAILDRVGMDHSTFTYSDDLGIATHYVANGDADLDVIHVAQAASGLYTSANDLGAFLAALMTDGELLTAGSLTEILAPAEDTDEAYGLGVYRDTPDDETAFFWHDGIGHGARSIFVIIPETGEGIIILTNSANGDNLYAPILCAFDAWAEAEAPRLCDW